MQRKIRIFTPLEFSRVLNVPNYKAKRFLEKQVREGLFVRLKKGLYSLKTDLPQEGEIANRLYQPSYLSFEYALAYYNILPEMPYAVTSATTKPTRTFTVGTKVFTYLKLKKNAYTGYAMTRRGGLFLLAEPEKALADYLYFVALGKKPFNERLNLSGLKREKLLGFINLYKRPKLVKLVHQLI